MFSGRLALVDTQSHLFMLSNLLFKLFLKFIEYNVKCVDLYSQISVSSYFSSYFLVFFPVETCKIVKVVKLITYYSCFV